MNLINNEKYQFYDKNQDSNNAEEEFIKQTQKMKILNLLKAIEEKRIIFQNFEKNKQKEEECKNSEDMNSNIEGRLKDIYLKYKHNLKYIKENIKKEEEKKENAKHKKKTFLHEQKNIENKNQEQKGDLELINQRYSQDIEMNLKKQNFWIM